MSARKLVRYFLILVPAAVAGMATSLIAHGQHEAGFLIWGMFVVLVVGWFSVNLVNQLKRVDRCDQCGSLFSCQCGEGDA